MVHECFFLDFIKIFVKSLQHKTHRKKNTASLNAWGFSKKFQLFNIWSKECSCRDHCSTNLTILMSYLLLSEADHRTVTTFMVPPFLTTLTVTVAGVSVSGSSTLIPLTSNSENIPNNIDTCSLFKF